MRRGRVPLEPGQYAHDVTVLLGEDENFKKLTDLGQNLERIEHVILAGYTVRRPNQIAASFTATVAGTTMTVTAVASGTLFAGSMITGAAIAPGTTIAAYGTGTGGTGTYTLNFPHTIGVAAAMTACGPGNLTTGTWLLDFPNTNLNPDESNNLKANGACLPIDNAEFTHVEHQVPRTICYAHKRYLNNLAVRVLDKTGANVTFCEMVLYLTFVMRDPEWRAEDVLRSDREEKLHYLPSLAYDGRLKYKF